ncbi:MAG: hypothetical protein K6U80_20040 [Firmicutes bacterium]|nr:hypothetical protein [Bacillota bacterium]
MNYRYSSDAAKAIRTELLYSDKVLVIKEISKLKGNDRKDMIARGLIKICDDAHYKGITVNSSLIFIDYASFLQKAWDNIGGYLNIMA